ncbi:MAG TPA: hypothetical protein VKA36_03870 [Solirubrobacterales bacterium]|nr:hypothetical protein [Solirubrobacterales bacterium]
MKAKTPIRQLLTDPPLPDRLIWRGLLNPDARNLGDRALVGSTFGTIYGLGGTVDPDHRRRLGDRPPAPVAGRQLRPAGRISALPD